MSLLLDTHAFIWLTEGSPRLPLAQREKIEEADVVFVSLASFWEMSIKLAVGKLKLKIDFEDIEDRFQEARLTLLPISIRDTVYQQRLPLHHKDPFDRIIIAQALNRSLTVVSRDAAFDDYEVQRVWDV